MPSPHQIARNIAKQDAEDNGHKMQRFRRRRNTDGTYYWRSYCRRCFDFLFVEEDGSRSGRTLKESCSVRYSP